MRRLTLCFSPLSPMPAAAPPRRSITPRAYIPRMFVRRACRQDMPVCLTRDLRQSTGTAAHSSPRRRARLHWPPHDCRQPVYTTHVCSPRLHDSSTSNFLSAEQKSFLFRIGAIGRRLPFAAQKTPTEMQASPLADHTAKCKQRSVGIFSEMKGKLLARARGEGDLQQYGKGRFRDRALPHAAAEHGLGASLVTQGVFAHKTYSAEVRIPLAHGVFADDAMDVAAREIGKQHIGKATDPII